MINKMWLLGLFSVALAGCGNGPGWLGAGLVIEDLLDPNEQAEDGLDGLPGLACYDLNANGECDEEEDVDQNGVCGVRDCRGQAGASGMPGVHGETGMEGIPGPIGPAGPPGVSPPPVVIVVLPVIVQPDDEDDDPAGGHPPHGNAWGSDGPHGNQDRP
jgi:hypothetical protein